MRARADFAAPEQGAPEAAPRRRRAPCRLGRGRLSPPLGDSGNFPQGFPSPFRNSYLARLPLFCSFKQKRSKMEARSAAERSGASEQRERAKRRHFASFLFERTEKGQFGKVGVAKRGRKTLWKITTPQARPGRCGAQCFVVPLLVSLHASQAGLLSIREQVLNNKCATFGCVRCAIGAKKSHIHTGNAADKAPSQVVGA